MAHVISDRVMETTTTTGTGTITVAGAVTGFVTLASRLTTSDTFDYVIFAVDSVGNPTGEWETGVGTYTAANQFSRSVRHSSNGDALVDFAAGTKRVALALTAFRARSGAIPLEKTGTTGDIENLEQGRYQYWNNAGTKSLTVRPNSTHAIDVGAEFYIRNDGAGKLTLVQGSGVTIKPPSSGSLIISEGMTVTLKNITTDIFHLLGHTDAA